MDLAQAQARFRFLADAFAGEGGFAPRVVWTDQTISMDAGKGGTTTATRRVPSVSGRCNLVPHARESAERYAARAAMAVYENHLREACDRFVGYLGRRLPMRTGVDSPLAALLVEDADLRGTSLNQFLIGVAMRLRARGSMLVLIDMPDQENPVSLLDQVQRRAVPYLREIAPEIVTDFELDSETGLFRSVEIACMEMVDGKLTECKRYWDAERWELRHGDKVLDQGPHPFRRCPVLSVTESGDEFPFIGAYAQIADMSLGVYNARSELDDLMRAQGFSVLAMQAPPDSSFDWRGAAATIGVHSMLVYPGEQPAFISPDAAQAASYIAKIDALQQSIKRVAKDEATTESGGAESGVSRRLRFERLNSELATFARRMESLERRIWDLFHRGLGITNRVRSEWPSDFNLVDTLAELDVLAAMQMGGFPPAALALKRRTIAAAEFDAADEEDMAAVLAAINEATQEGATPAAGGDDTMTGD